jgi:hypothetical protein
MWNDSSEKALKGGLGRRRSNPFQQEKNPDSHGGALDRSWRPGSGAKGHEPVFPPLRDTLTMGPETCLDHDLKNGASVLKLEIGLDS